MAATLLLLPVALASGAASLSALQSRLDAARSFEANDLVEGGPSPHIHAELLQDSIGPLEGTS